MGGILQVDTIQNNNATTLITQTNSTTLTFGVSGQNIVIPSGVTFNTASATVNLPSTINATTINVTTLVLAAGAVGTPSLTTSGDTNTGIFFSAADTIDFAEGGAATGQFDSSGNFKFNSGYGSVATAYGCRAWVNFDGTGTPAIRASGNVSSLTDNGTGDYTVNFTTALTDANYAVGQNTKAANTTSRTTSQLQAISKTTTSVRCLTQQTTPTATDHVICDVSIFR
jgi:hypothetical protein